MNKIEAVKYIILKLCDWYYEVNPTKKDTDTNDLSILKVLKLIFLLAPIEYKNRSLLNNNFQFQAWALGPVEVDIYNERENLFIDLKRKKTNYRDLKKENINLNPQDREFIDSIVNILRNKNKYLISNSAIQLVDLTHRFSSWIRPYNSNIPDMDSSVIMSEEKFYYYD